MFGNYLATALRNLARNWLYATISIAGLAVAFAAAILVAVFVINEFSYDRFIPGYQQVYRISEKIAQPGQPPIESDVVQTTIAANAKLADPEILATARLSQDYPSLRHNAGDTPIIEQTFAWADPDTFTVLPLPVLAGDLKTALQQPDTVVITREMARKYFGRDVPIGDTLIADIGPTAERHPLRVTAVLKDLPSNTHLVPEIFASARSAYSPLAKLEGKPDPGYSTNSTYLRLSPNASQDALRRSLELAARPYARMFANFGSKVDLKLEPVPLAAIHLRPAGLGTQAAKPSGSRTTILAIATVAALILLVAAINFVTLMTARASRRAVEVGIRKAAGARRSDLMVQFMGEALIYVGLSLLAGLILAALLVKPFGAFLQRGLSLDFFHQPTLLGGIILAALVVGLAAGVYPALILSGFRPAAVLKGGVIQTGGSAIARQGLVVAQFAILIGLILATTTIYRQTTYALNQGLGSDSKLIMAIFTRCDVAFPDEVRRLPGVSAGACATQAALNFPAARGVAPVTMPDGRGVNFKPAVVDFGFFEMFGLKPLAGRLFSRDHGEDDMLRDPNSTAQPPVIINESGAHALGFASPAAAIGHRMIWPRYSDAIQHPTPQPSEIVGVVPDVPTTVRAPTDPTFYYVDPHGVYMLAAKMTGKDMPDTIRAIERVWKATGNTRPIQEVFLDQRRHAQYLDIITQGVTIAVCAVIAVLIACLGLFALSAFTTERRTKEIGIRKVMGASTTDVMRLFMWQFTQPVLWAILIACPIGLLVMNRWLHGFAYHVDLSVWSFVLAAATALVVAWLTVSFQSYMVARAKPVGALRYE